MLLLIRSVSVTLLSIGECGHCRSRSYAPVEQWEKGGTSPPPQEGFRQVSWKVCVMGFGPSSGFMKVMKISCRSCCLFPLYLWGRLFLNVV